VARVRRHEPAVRAQTIGQVEEREAVPFPVAQRPGHGGQATVAVVEELERAQAGDLLGQVAGGVVAGLVDPPVALAAEPQEGVVLSGDLASRA